MRKIIPFILSFLILSPAFAFTDEEIRDYDFSSIDRHALSAPTALEGNMYGLVQYLTQAARNDMEKVRAISVWIADRITYDFYLFDSMAGLAPRAVNTSQKAYDVFNSRFAVCEGFAKLFSEMAKIARIETKDVSGYGKDSPEMLIDERDLREGKYNHAWNAVKIGPRWHLIDVTWMSSGTVLPINSAVARSVTMNRARMERIKNRSYEQEFRRNGSLNEEWFLTPPERMALTHFPRQQQFQYLQNPVREREFKEARIRRDLLRPKRFPGNTPVDQYIPRPYTPPGETALPYGGGQQPIGF